MGKPATDPEHADIFDVTDGEAAEASMRRAEADFAAGRVVSHSAVRRWLLSWGSANRLPPPECGE